MRCDHCIGVARIICFKDNTNGCLYGEDVDDEPIKKDDLPIKGAIPKARPDKNILDSNRGRHSSKGKVVTEVEPKTN